MDHIKRTDLSNTYEIIVETGWSETFEVKAGSLAEALELIDNDEIDPLSYGKVGDQKYNLRVGGSNNAVYKEIIGGQIGCDCDDPCEQNEDCLCHKIPCEDDEGICEHTRGCLHGECNCFCEF
tara:strand:+ start:417 stop:785 length:369 start_codon:yes stop_codon:yes gene_type:complete